ncbi:hypothetical protein ARAM_006919 [Aspergillus rambellii]|uniref:Pyroglutamyl peptidase type I n=1 Tax=Aspergillus rambellii TaxID=308745 RepID=A0A0F8UJE0_9EURO|nr:hypothetical protein ARAM_006919 [Aspergillus rambellii]
MGDLGSGALSSNTQLSGNLPSPSTDQEEISVLVTGFGPFKSNLVNASYLIASALPSSLSLPSPASKSPDGLPTARRISIHVHPSPINVAYSAVRTTVPAILDDYVKTHGRHPDIVIHMGIAATRSYYSVETQAHRDAYHISDNLGRAGYEDGEKIWKELGLPFVLQAGCTSDLAPGAPAQARAQLNPHPPDAALLQAWQAFAPPNAQVRLSEDAGRYLCEFILYTSLSLALLENRDRRTMFLHVPASCADEDIETGKEIAIALIKALVACWVDENIY